MLVSFAGPGINLLVAMVATILLVLVGLGIRMLFPAAVGVSLATPYAVMSLAGVPNARTVLIVIGFLKLMILQSLVLGCFNLIPVPPLDGSWILSGLLGERFNRLFEQFRPFSFILLIALVAVGLLDRLLAIPVGAAWIVMHASFVAMGFG